jgi:tRNA(Ile)-lysidine synthase
LAQDLLDNLVVDFKRKNFISSANGIKITNSSLLELKALDYYLHSLFAPYGFNNITDLHQLMQAKSGKQLFSKTHRLVKDRDCFLLTENISKDDKTHVINADFNKIDHPIPLIFSNEKTVLDKGPKKLFLDKSKLKFPLYIRKWKQSDYFYPYGMDGKKKLSKYFKDEKFSLLEKESQWLLCSSDDVVWVIGKRADARFLADAKSDNIWLIKLND